MNTKTVGAFMVMLIAASVNADLIVQVTSATHDGGTPHQSSLPNSIDGTGLSSALNDGDPVPGTLPTHSDNYTLGVRWLGGQWPTMVTFDLGGAQTDPLNSVILYNHNEFGASLTRGVQSVDIWTSTNNGANYSLFQNDLAFAQASIDGSNQTLAQTVDFSSTISPGVTHIQFRDLQNHGDSIIGFGEVRFTAIPEPASIGLLGFAVGLLLFVRRRVS